MTLHVVLRYATFGYNNFSKNKVYHPHMWGIISVFNFLMYTTNVIGTLLLRLSSGLDIKPLRFYLHHMTHLGQIWLDEVHGFEQMTLYVSLNGNWGTLELHQWEGESLFDGTDVRGQPGGGVDAQTQRGNRKLQQIEVITSANCFSIPSGVPHCLGQIHLLTHKINFSRPCLFGLFADNKKKQSMKQQTSLNNSATSGRTGAISSPPCSGSGSPANRVFNLNGVV